MYKINRFKVHGFRRLLDIDMQVRPLMVLIGANGIGKSSFLDAFNLLSASASGKMNSSLSSFGGIASLLTRGKSEELSFHIDIGATESSEFNYQLQLIARGTGYQIAREKLCQHETELGQQLKYLDSAGDMVQYFEQPKNAILRPDWNYEPLETALSQVPKIFRQQEELRRVLVSVTHYHLLDVGPRAAIKLPQSMRPATLPGSDGGDLVPYLYYLREVDSDRFESVVDSLQAAFPDFEELAFPPVAAGMLAMTWKDRKFSKPIYMNELSAGTLRFLWLVSLLQSPSLSAVTMIDEPEVSLHPEMLSLLADLMREASKRTQLLVATHSDRLIRFLDPSEVVVMDMDDAGCANARWADSMDLDRWLSEYSLDEVWGMGCMGGRT